MSFAQHIVLTQMQTMLRTVLSVCMMCSICTWTECRVLSKGCLLELAVTCVHYLGWTAGFAIIKRCMAFVHASVLRVRSDLYEIVGVSQ